MTLVTIRLRVRDKHGAELRRQACAANVVWNYCNEVSKKAWLDHRRWLSAFDLQKLTAGASKELRIHAHTIQRVCKQITLSRLASRTPSVRWRGRKSLGWVPFNTGHVTFDGNAFLFLGRKYSVMHTRRDILVAGMKIFAGSFNADGRGRWYINVPVLIEDPIANDRSPVGIDLGLKDLATLSSGQAICAPQFYRKSEAALSTIQKLRKPKRVRAIHAKAANRRKDFLHKASLKIAKEFGTIVVGNVSPKKLAKTRMAKSINDAGWATFKNMLSYKAIMHGGKMIEVNEAMTTQTCSACGCLPASRPRGIAGLRIREWQCDDCGTVHDRDVNAAKNILRIGLDTLAEGAA